MLRSRKNAGRFHTNCYYGCCPSFASTLQERRYFKRKEKEAWKKEAKKEMQNDY